MRGAWIGELSWPDVAARLRDGAVVIVPVGAAAKAHGAHLPLDTDRVIAGALARRVAEELPVLVAPIIDVGWYPAFVPYPGSQSISHDTFLSLVVQVLVKLIGDGAQHLAIINTGVSTEVPLGIAAHEVRERTGVKIAIADIRNLGRDANALLEQSGDGGHADEHETSLMLAIDPQRVRMDRARREPPTGAGSGAFRRPIVLSPDGDDEDRSESGATGDPTLATAEKGERILAAITLDLVRGLRSSFSHIDAGE